MCFEIWNSEAVVAIEKWARIIIFFYITSLFRRRPPLKPGKKDCFALTCNLTLKPN